MLCINYNVSAVHRTLISGDLILQPGLPFLQADALSTPGAFNPRPAGHLWLAKAFKVAR